MLGVLLLLENLDEAGLLRRVELPGPCSGFRRGWGSALDWQAVSSIAVACWGSSLTPAENGCSSANCRR